MRQRKKIYNPGLVDDQLSVTDMKEQNLSVSYKVLTHSSSYHVLVFTPCSASCLLFEGLFPVILLVLWSNIVAYVKI